MVLKVPLHDLLIELGGDMGEFAGFKTAMSFGDPINEHLAVRREAGLFDISHMGRIYLSGGDVYKLLDALIPKDLSKSSDNKMFGPTAFLNERGGFRDDVMLYRFKEDHWLIVCNAVNREKIFSWLRDWRERLGFLNVDIKDLTLEKPMLAFQGPKARDYIEKIKGLKDAIYLEPLTFLRDVETEFGRIDIISRSGWTGEDGFEIIGEPDVLAKIMRYFKGQGIRLAGLIARDTLRLEMGYVLYGNDIDEDINPLEARYWVFDEKKSGCVGCDALREIGKKGVEKIRYGIRMKKGVKMIPRHGYEIIYQGEVVGYVTSGGYSPTLERGIGMGYIRSSHALPGLDVEIRYRDRVAEAKILDFPLIKR